MLPSQFHRLEKIQGKDGNGLDKIIEGNGINISGGEAQRIAVARALSSSAPFLIFDEMSSDLDEENARLLEERILQNTSGALIITHRLFPENLKNYDEILFMEAGKIVTGRPDLEKS